MKTVYSTQSNTLVGLLTLAAVAATCQTEGLLCKLGSTGLTDVAAIGDLATYLVLERGDDTATVFPLTEGGENCRIRLNGTCAKGDVLVLATGGDLGKVTKLAAQTGKLFRVGIAEEAGVDEQLVLVRPMPGFIYAPIAFSGATPASTAPTNSSPYGFGQTQAQALLTTVIEMRAALVANGIMS
jgi:hypothetical protein